MDCQEHQLSHHSSAWTIANECKSSGEVGGVVGEQNRGREGTAWERVTIGAGDQGPGGVGIGSTATTHMPNPVAGGPHEGPRGSQSVTAQSYSATSSTSYLSGLTRPPLLHRDGLPPPPPPGRNQMGPVLSLILVLMYLQCNPKVSE